MKFNRIFIAGHKGLVGSAIIRLLKKKNVKIITKDKKELDLLNQNKVYNFFKSHKIDQVYLAAAKVGGIFANKNYPAEFIYQNIMIQTNVIHGAFLGGVKKLLFLGSNCIYPKYTNQPMKEDQLLTGKLDENIEPYAVSKITGCKMCESYNRQYRKTHNIDYRCIMPANLYGPGDNYHPENSHVIPGLIHRFHQAKIKKLPVVKVWGSGKSRREFIFSHDLAKASIHVMNLGKKKFIEQTDPMCGHINVGSGKEYTITQLAKIIKEIVDYKGKIEFDKSKPNGSPRKLFDTGRLNNLGFKAAISLREGLRITYDDYIRTFK